MAGSVGSIIGTGDGRGIGFMIVLIGLATTLLGVLGYAHPRIRHAESELADELPEGAPVASVVPIAEPLPDPAV